MSNVYFIPDRHGNSWLFEEIKKENKMNKKVHKILSLFLTNFSIVQVAKCSFVPTYFPFSFSHGLQFLNQLDTLSLINLHIKQILYLLVHLLGHVYPHLIGKYISLFLIHAHVTHKIGFYHSTNLQVEIFLNLSNKHTSWK